MLTLTLTLTLTLALALTCKDMYLVTRRVSVLCSANWLFRLWEHWHSLLRTLPSTRIQAVHVMCPWALKQSRSRTVTKSRYDRETRRRERGQGQVVKEYVVQCIWLGVLCRQDEQAEESERSAGYLYTGARETCATGGGVRGSAGGVMGSTEGVRGIAEESREAQRSQKKYRGVIGSAGESEEGG